MHSTVDPYWDFGGRSWNYLTQTESNFLPNLQPPSTGQHTGPDTNDSGPF